MILNGQIALSVLEAWKADQEHPHRGRDKREYPSEQRLADLLDIAFRASLLNEEGTPIRGSITMLSPEELVKQEIPYRRSSNLVIRLSEPRILDVEVVGKLALTTESGTSSLLVHWFDGTCKVWGIIYYEKHLSPLSCISVGFVNFRHFAPDALTIEITGVGSLKISRAHIVISRIDKGEFSASVPTPIAPEAMGKSLYGLFKIEVRGHLFASEADGFRGRLLFECLEYLLARINKQGGGATIIFIPKSDSSPLILPAKFPWKCDGGLEFVDLMKERINYSKGSGRGVVSGLAKLDMILRQRLDNLAQLAALDGAVILTPDFGIVGFGVKLQAPVYSGEVREGPDGFKANGGLIDFSRLGTRHNSALAFIASIPGSVGFIASEDGPIRGLVMMPNGVVNCWPDCRVSMFC